MSSKRPHDPSGPDSDAKRIRSNAGSPAPAPNGSSQTSGETEMERKKREAAERMAAVKARLAATKANGAAPVASAGIGLGGGQATAAPPIANGGASDVEAKKAEAQKKIAEMKARMAAQRAGTGAGTTSTASPVNGGIGQPPPNQQSDREARIAEARRRAAELSQSRNLTPTPAPPPRQDGKAARGGLGVGLHPSLLGDGPTAGGKGKTSTVQGPKFSTTKGNQQPEKPKLNPYLPDDNEAPTTATAADDDGTHDPNLSNKARERKSKHLSFHTKGKFVAQAAALRQQARLEEMKRRIAAETRKVEIEEASDRSFLVPAPPEVEWWDEGLLLPSETKGEGGGPLKTYTACLEPGHNNITTDDSIITSLIQRPALLAPPQDKFIPAPKPLMLTSQEQKKLRRQRRMADMKEEQAKIRLGLVEPPPPKVKKSNMMRVLGEQAVKDPTAVEARVNREIAARAADHVKSNEDRKLTKEERAEKLKLQQKGDEAKGVKVAVFRVDDLSSGKHRFLVDLNAKQQALTGIVVLHPTMNLIIVEGGTHSIAAYKKLMLNRIKWSENTLPLTDAAPSTFTANPSSSSTNPNITDTAGGGTKAAEWLHPLDPSTGQLKDLSENKCVLVWEGEEGKRSFKRWGSRAVLTDGEAKDVLRRGGMENMWTLGRSK